MRFNLDIENDSYKNLETVITHFETIHTEYQKQKQDACDKFKVAFENFMGDFFKLVPSVKQVTWTQYTPYFMDGDTCVFSMNEPYFANFVKDSDEDDEVDNEEGTINQKGQWEINTWHLRDSDKYGLTDKEQKVIQFLNDTIYNNEEFFYDIYGDHQQITMTENGVVSEYYEHD